MLRLSFWRSVYERYRYFDYFLMSERDHQVNLFRWANYQVGKYPELRFMFHPPNGGLRNIGVARKLKAEGVKSGVPDVLLLVPIGDFIGFAAELKFGKNKPSKNQLEWIEFLKEQGFFCKVYWDWQECADDLLLYLDEKLKQSN